MFLAAAEFVVVLYHTLCECDCTRATEIWDQRKVKWYQSLGSGHSTIGYLFFCIWTKI